MRNYFTKILYQKRFFIVGWFLGIVAVTALTMAFYHTFSDPSFDKALSSLPPAFRKLAGTAAEQRTVAGYAGQQIFAFRAPLLLIIMSIALLVGLTGGDEQKGLLETQLAGPYSRSRLLAQKLAAAFTAVIMASLGSLLGIYGALAFLGESYALENGLEHLVNCLILALDYGLVAATIAVVTGKRSMALGIGSGFAFLSYLINSMAVSVSALQPVDKLTFFHYYNIVSPSWRSALSLLCVAMLLLVISFVGFNRRDIRAR